MKVTQNRLHDSVTPQNKYLIPPCQPRISQFSNSWWENFVVVYSTPRLSFAEHKGKKF